MLAPRRVIRFVILLAVVCAAGAGLLHIRQGTLVGPFALEASEQWIVRQDQPGEVVARYTTGRREIAQGVQVYQFPRGDMIQITLVSNLSEGARVAANTPIMELCSLTDPVMREMLTARTNRLAMELNLAMPVEGRARAEQLTAEVDLAAKELQAYRALIDRRKKLADQGIMSSDELEQMELEYARRKLTAASAQTQMEYRRLQLNSENIAVIEAQLEETRQELKLVQARLAARWLVTPIVGRLTRYSGVPEILLRVVNDQDMVARVVVPIAFADQIKIGDPVELVFASMGLRSVTASIARIEVNAVPMLGQSVAHLIVPVANADGSLQVAMTGQAVLRSVKANPWAALWWRMRLSGFDDVARKNNEP